MPRQSVNYQGPRKQRALSLDRALLILRLTERAFLSLLLATGNVSAHNAVCVLKLEGHFRESSEKNLYIAAKQMDEELRTQVPLGFFHPTDAQSRPGNPGPSESVS